MDDDLSALADSDGVSVHSGFPNPALDRRDRGRELALNLNQLLVRHPSSSYLFRISGHRWAEHGIRDGDLALVDRAAEAGPSDLVVIWQNDNFTIMPQRQLDRAELPWGTVVAVIHQYRNHLEAA